MQLPFQPLDESLPSSQSVAPRDTKPPRTELRKRFLKRKGIWLPAVSRFRSYRPKTRHRHAGVGEQGAHRLGGLAGFVFHLPK